MQEKIPAKIKQKVEDFIVEEITPLGKCILSPILPQKTDIGNLDITEKKDFLWADMEKKDWIFGRKSFQDNDPRHRQKRIQQNCQQNKKIHIFSKLLRKSTFW